MGSTAATMRVCSETVREQGPWPKYHQCTKPVTVERDGKWFCKIHDPIAVKARGEKTANSYAAVRATESLLTGSLRAIREIADGHNDAKALAQSVLEAHPDVLAKFIVTVRKW